VPRPGLLQPGVDRRPLQRRPVRRQGLHPDRGVQTLRVAVVLPEQVEPVVGVAEGERVDRPAPLRETPSMTKRCVTANSSSTGMAAMTPPAMIVV
jgi:hypothetical protein